MTEHPEVINYGPTFGKRHIQVILLFFLLTIGVAMRLQLAVAVVAMTDSTTSPNPDVPTYDWDNKSVILSSFYWGYITVQLVAGALGRLYGTKNILIGAMFFNGTASCFVPLLADKFGSYGVIACRVFQGISQGSFYPSIYNLLGQWTPLSERSRLGTIALAGYAFGSVIASPLVGYMSSTWWGWPSTYYLFGILAYIWTVLWAIFGANNPAEHKTIKKEEKDYIEKSLGSDDSAVKIIPWKGVLTSIPLWSLALVSGGVNWGAITTGTETPLYMNKIMKYDISTNGVLASLPSVATFVANFLASYVSDYVINNKWMSRGLTRKVFSSITCIGMGAPLVILSCLPEDANTWSVIMLVTTGFFYGALYGGTGVNQIDLSPRYAGVIMSITNTVANTFSLVAPLAVQVVVTDETDKSQWAIIFYITAGILFFTNTVYLILGTGELQSWNSYGESTEKPLDDTTLESEKNNTNIPTTS